MRANLDGVISIAISKRRCLLNSVFEKSNAIMVVEEAFILFFK